MRRVIHPEIGERVVTPLGRIARVIGASDEPTRRGLRDVELEFVRLEYLDRKLGEADLATAILAGYDGPAVLFRDEQARLTRLYGIALAGDEP